MFAFPYHREASSSLGRHLTRKEAGYLGKGRSFLSSPLWWPGPFLPDATFCRGLTQTDSLSNPPQQQRQQALLLGHDLSLTGHAELDPASEVPAPHLVLLQVNPDEVLGRP